jgi:hypothetical protein
MPNAQKTKIKEQERERYVLERSPSKKEADTHLEFRKLPARIKDCWKLTPCGLWNWVGDEN